jgi:hypothetical protein
MSITPISYIQLSKSPPYNDHNHRRFWILALLAGTERAGINPMDIGQFNMLAYLANAVARCYDIEPLNPIVLKEKNGILYPKLIWDLDRLVGMGLVRVSNIVLTSQGETKSVSYGITNRGINSLKACTEVSEGLKNTAAALSSTAMAFCRTRNNIDIESLHSRDGNLADNRFSDGDVVDFGLWDLNNSTANSVDFVKENISPVLPGSISTAVNLYAQYLAFLTSESH